MSKLAEVQPVLESAEIVTIGSCSDGGVHLVATWGEYVRQLGVQDEDVLLVPAGGYSTTEQNLARNPSVEVLVASKSAGTGFRLAGHADVQTSGPWADMVAAEFKWARGALVIHVEEVTKLL